MNCVLDAARLNSPRRTRGRKKLQRLVASVKTDNIHINRFHYFIVHDRVRRKDRDHREGIRACIECRAVVLA